MNRTLKRISLPLLFSLMALMSGCFFSPGTIATRGPAIQANSNNCGTAEAMERVASRNTCNNPQSYECDYQIFSPEVDNQRSTASECGTISGVGEICLKVLSISVYTGNLIGSDIPVSQFEPGGAYNFSTYQCSNFLGGTGFGSTLSAALNNTYAACQARN